MSIANYGELQTAVADWADRTDLTARMPDFIRTAHDRIVREVVIGAELSASSDTVAQPDDFRQVSSLWLDRFPKRPLVVADELQMQTSGSGPPSAYRIDGTDFILAPTPDQTYPLWVLYKIVTTFFADDSATNVILTKYPNVYLWGALAEVGAYLKDAELALGYGQKFTDEIERINRAERGDVMDGPLQASPSTAYGVTP